ncbi:MAG TPA: hypothetical protein VGC54_01285 [Planctomycetota bacterium]
MRRALPFSFLTVPRPGVLGLGLLAGLVAAGCTARATSEGDRLYRLGEFDRALTEYQRAEDGSAEGRERVRQTEYMVYADGARELLHLNRPKDAVTVLDYAEGIRPGHPYTAELRARAGKKLAEELTREARELFEDGEAAAAVGVYTEALGWNPEFAEARQGLVRATALARGIRNSGQRHYDQGLEELDGGHDGRARTAFMHATTFWGADNRAGQLLEELSGRLAAESRDEGRRYFRLGMIGPAWVALRDANRLQPGDAETTEMIARIEARIRAEGQLVRADMLVRAGEPEPASELIDQAEAAAAGELEGEIWALRRAAENARQRHRYLEARSTELDRRVVEATRIYDEILRETGEEGFEDVSRRARMLHARLDRAATAYQAALAAEAAGDRARYAEKLAEVVRLAADYKDAALRLGALSGG